MEEKIIIVIFIMVIISFICIGIFLYYIGYIKGFKKAKKIDDEILLKLRNKYIN